MSANEKKRTKDEILAKLDPKTREQFLDASDHKISRVATPSLGINIALNGGFPYGRMIGLYGNRSSGKSTTALQIIAKAQEEGNVCAYIDVEKTFDTTWAQRLGVNTDELLLSQSTSITKCTRDILRLEAAGVNMIVVDSISAMLPSVYFDDKGNFKDVQDSKQIGAQARELAIAIAEWNAEIGDTCLIVISQIRNQFGHHVSHIPSGGKAFGHFSSVILKLTSSEAESQAIKGNVSHGDLVFEEVIGRDVKWLCEKDKTGNGTFKAGRYNFYFSGDYIGIDNVEEVLNYAVLYGLIDKAGAGWYTIEGQKFQGTKAVDFLASNPELVAEYEKRIIYGG